jgi:hypothetical protein
MSQPATQSESDYALPRIASTDPQSPEEKAEEARRIRRLQLMMTMVMQVIQQDRRLPVEQASEMVADARRAALAMFPDKALAFDLIFWPRLQRLMRERYRMQ